ncbi:MAG: SPOR domain-containing protein [Ignavibacteriaceae bacterium]
MTRSELIRKIARYAGVPESETKVFFEIFLKRLPVILKIGQALYVNHFGYFYLLQGKIKKQTVSEEYDVENHDVIDLVYFTPGVVKQNELFDDGLFFNVPVSDEEEFNAVDASFSLSFGKPLIPFKGNVEPGFYFPHTGLELRKLIESKVDKTIGSGEITEISDLLLGFIDIDSDIYNQSIKQSNEKDNLLHKDDQEITDVTAQIAFEDQIKKSGWELDRNLSKEIEEDAIIDLAESEDNSESAKERQRLSWDFESFELAEPDVISDETTTGLDDDLVDKPKIDIEYDKKSLEGKSKQTETTESKEKFERVKTFADMLDDKLINGTEIFTPITPDKLEPDTTHKGRDKEDSEDKEIEFIEFKSVTKSADIRKEKERVRKSVLQLEERKKRRFNKDNRYENNKVRKSIRRSSIMPYLMLIASICIIGYSIYYYITHIKDVSEQPVVENAVAFNTDKMNVIERDFEFPVSYPYPKRIDNPDMVSGIFEIEINDAAIIQQPDDPEPVKQIEVQNNAIPEQLVERNDEPPHGEIKKLGINLFQYGNVYIVQVAAFRSNSVAQTEAERFRNKGYNSFVERAEIDGSTWHRVKVGNFKELKEAEKFAVQFK